MAPLGPCCATGSLHTGTPAGRIGKVHGLDCYIAEPPSDPPKGIVVIVPDAFGWELPNNRILADCYAKEGNFRVYLPEFMAGCAAPADIMVSLKALSATGFWNQVYKVGHVAYMARHFIPFLILNRASVTEPRVFGFLKDLKQNEAKDLPVGTAGFCWGAPFVTKFCWDQEVNKTPDGKRITNCGFVAHPSNLSYPADIEKISLPYAVAASEHDQMMSPAQAKQTEEILKTKSEKAKGTGVEHEFVMYLGAHHGFAVRADEDDKEEAERGKRAEAQAVAWFNRWFSNKSLTV